MDVIGTINLLPQHDHQVSDLRKSFFSGWTPRVLTVRSTTRPELNFACRASGHGYDYQEIAAFRGIHGSSDIRPAA